MARKKLSGKGINLLKGITGTQLAKLIAVIAIILAIPVTVLMSQQQQNTQQEASFGIGAGIKLGVTQCGLYKPAGGKCISLAQCKANGWYAAANCATGGVCCIPPVVDSCSVNNYGHCQFTYVYCKSGTWISNKCLGQVPTNYKCCKN